MPLHLLAGSSSVGSACVIGGRRELNATDLIEQRLSRDNLPLNTQ